jgi:uncharacterized RDD family membrane protein YckC
MEWTDEIRLETPEQIGVDLELAGLGTRFVAQTVDWAIKGLVGFAVFMLGAIVAGAMVLDPDLERASPFLLALVAAALYAFFTGYDVYFEVRHHGQTPGKKYAGIRVIRDGGAAVDFRTSCVRNLLAPADFLPGCFVLGAALVFFTARHQRLGDLAAGTLVIRERALEAPGDLSRIVDRLASAEHIFAARHLTACAPTDRALLRAFLLRLGEMDEAGRDRLALKLAGLLLQKTGYQPTLPIRDGDRATAFLASLFRDLEDQSRRKY